MKILSDGTVIQSSLSENNIDANEIFFKDYGLKIGVVTAIHYPDEKTNISKKFIEYDVLAGEERADGSVSLVNYLRCRVLELFGAPQHFVRYTLQPPASQKDEVYYQGSQVALLVRSGNASYGKAFIIGGLTEPPANSIKKDDGHFYEFQFNGVNIKIDKDGQYNLTWNGLLDPDGKKLNEKASGTKIDIFKNGSLKLSDNEGQFFELNREEQTITISNGAEIIKIDKKNKKIEIKTEGEMSTESKKDTKIKSDKGIEIESKDSIKQKATKDIEQEANANIKTKANSNWQVEVGGNVEIKSGGNVTIQGGANVKIAGTVNLIGQGSAPAAGVGISKCIGIGNLGAPVVSDIITGSATVLIGS